MVNVASVVGHCPANAPGPRPILPGTQSVHVKDEAALDFPAAQVMHSLSLSLAVRLLSRYVPAGQLVQGSTVGLIAARWESKVNPLMQTRRVGEYRRPKYGQDSKKDSRLADLATHQAWHVCKFTDAADLARRAVSSCACAAAFWVRRCAQHKERTLRNLSLSLSPSRALSIYRSLSLHTRTCQLRRNKFPHCKPRTQSFPKCL